MLYYTPINLWSLIIAANDFSHSWRSDYRAARRAFAIFDLRAARGTLRFKKDNSKLSVMCLPVELRVYILQLLKDIVQQRDRFEEDDYDSEEEYSDPWDCDRPNFSMQGQIEGYLELFCEIFGDAGDLMGDRLFSFNQSCPCHFSEDLCEEEQYWGVGWDPLPEKICPNAICDPRKHWEDVKDYFRYTETMQKVSDIITASCLIRLLQQIEAFLDYYELELLDDLVPKFDYMEPWFNPFQLEARVAY
jgi:hypothetical protein